MVCTIIAGDLSLYLLLSVEILKFHNNLCELSGEDPEETAFLKLRITAASKEHDLTDRTLADFAADPLAFDLNEMCPEEDIKEMAVLCEELRKELYCGQHDHEQPSY